MGEVSEMMLDGTLCQECGIFVGEPEGFPRKCPGCTSRRAKAAHVKRAKQTRSHHCHWPGCEKPVPPAMWGCKAHWFTLPKPLRDRIWATYRPGQEETADPSSAYLEAAGAVQQWIRAQQLLAQGKENAS